MLKLESHGSNIEIQLNQLFDLSVIRFRGWAAQLAVFASLLAYFRKWSWSQRGRMLSSEKHIPNLGSSNMAGQSPNWMKVFHRKITDFYGRFSQHAMFFHDTKEGLRYSSWCRITFMATNLLSLSAQGQTSGNRAGKRPRNLHSKLSELWLV